MAVQENGITIGEIDDTRGTICVLYGSTEWLFWLDEATQRFREIRRFSWGGSGRESIPNDVFIELLRQMFAIARERGWMTKMTTA